MSKDVVIYTCPYCSEVYNSAQKLKGHLLKIHQMTCSVCRSCPLIFETLAALFLHAREIHNKEKRDAKQDCKLACEYSGCSYKTNNGGLMKHHYRSHTNHKPHKCDICEKTFTQKSNMKTHFNRHLKGGVVFPCEICEKVFYSYDIYLSHLGTREHELSQLKLILDDKLKCMICQEEFDTPEEVVEHCYKCENSKILGETISCQKCHRKMLLDINVMKSHIKEHRKEITCQLCDETFDDVSKWNFHLTKHHKQPVSRKSACPYCEQIFNSVDERKEHVTMQHADIKNRHLSRGDFGRMECSVCHNFFSNSKIIMQKHIAKEHCHNIDVNNEYKKLNVQNCIKTPETHEKVDHSKPRNRGRPRLCDQVTLKKDVESSQENFNEPKRKRGRPQKVLETSFDDKEIRKRGRPKKIKLELVDNNARIQTESNEAEFEYNIDDFDNRYILDEHMDKCINNGQFKTEDYNLDF